MKNLNEIDLRWQRIIPILLCLTAISYITSRIGTQKHFKPVNNCDEVISNVDRSPNFKGGDEAILEFNQHYVLPILYKSISSRNEIMSKLEYEIIISESGTIVDCEIVNQIPKELKANLKNVIYKMPKWEPAIKNDQPVCYKIRIPLYINWDEKSLNQIIN